MENAKVVYIQRDYSQGTTPRFLNEIPQPLENKISQAEFDHAINQINSLFEEAETPSAKLYALNFLSCIFFYLLDLCIPNPYEQIHREVSATAKRIDKEIFQPKGMRFVDPLRRGLRVIEIQVLG
eukprot:m.7685 g.7685  ORF g.7685 m.7685 type:complete len:125 (-) comp2885_c0_seq1:50-424(-)